jgi:hypothetical protein
MEEVDEQLNATSKHLLQQAVPDTHAAHINNLSTAKEVWDYLTMLFIGNESKPGDGFYLTGCIGLVFPLGFL